MDYVSFSNVYPESLLKLGDRFEFQQCPAASFAKIRWPGVRRGYTQVSLAICSVGDPRSPSLRASPGSREK